MIFNPDDGNLSLKNNVILMRMDCKSRVVISFVFDVKDGQTLGKFNKLSWQIKEYI